MKVLILDDQHRVLGVANSQITASRPHALWSEQDPDQWWQALLYCINSLRLELPQHFAAIRAIGLSGQMHGAVVLDSEHRVLRPAILWNDGRAQAQCLELESAVPEYAAVTGNRVMPGFTAPKILWMKQNEPRIYAQISKVLLPKDWLRLKLTGDVVSEMSDASGTAWLDVGRRAWSEKLLSACGLNVSYMPRLIEGNQVSGHLNSHLAQAWGLRASIPIAGGGGDNAASAVGVGAVSPGQSLISLGTSGVVFKVSESFAPQLERALHMFAHALPRRWHYMAVMLSASSALSWVTQLTQSSSDKELALLAFALTPSQRARAPIFLPYLAGERTPHNNMQASGTFIGLRHDHDRAALAYAVMEGVTFGLVDGASSMQSPALNSSSVAVAGGGSQSDGWVQMMASVFQQEMLRYKEGYAAAAMGAARLAWLCDGGKESDVCIQPEVSGRFEPVSSQSRLLSDRLGQFLLLYPALKEHFH